MQKEITRRGFTLIELLVVVLIVGILTAVAVPLYQKSVRMSHYKKMLPLLHHTVQLQQVFFLANGRYATTFDELDPDLKKNGNTGCNEYFVNDKAKQDGFCLSLTTVGGVRVSGLSTKITGVDAESSSWSGYEYLLQDAGWPAYLKKGLYCRTSTEQDKHCTGQLAKQNWYRDWYYMQ